MGNDALLFIGALALIGFLGGLALSELGRLLGTIVLGLLGLGIATVLGLLPIPADWWHTFGSMLSETLPLVRMLVEHVHLLLQQLFSRTPELGPGALTVGMLAGLVVRRFRRSAS